MLPDSTPAIKATISYTSKSFQGQLFGESRNPLNDVEALVLESKVEFFFSKNNS